MRALRLMAGLSIASLMIVAVVSFARQALPALSAPPPTITLVEASTQRSCGPAQTVVGGGPQYHITVSGTGLDPSIVAVSITFDANGKAPENYPGPYRVVNGSFKVLLQPGPFYRPFGTYTVLVHPLGNFAIAIPGYPAYFQVPCTTLVVKPVCATAGDPITIVGAGFAPRLPVHLFLNPGAIALPDAPNAVGSFQFTVAFPNVPPALYELVANQPNRLPQDVRTANARIQVPCFNPVLKLVPTVGPPGTVTTAIGTGYPPSAKVDFTWTVGIIATGAATVVTTTSGTFTFEILIFPHDTIGARQLVARRDPSAPNFVTTKANFLVVQGSVQPNDFSWRN